MVKLSDLFDLDYPWLPDFTFSDDGTAYFVALQKRADSDFAEGLLYRVTGL
jgi:hypothetical protein